MLIVGTIFIGKNGNNYPIWITGLILTIVGGTWAFCSWLILCGATCKILGLLTMYDALTLKRPTQNYDILTSE